MNPLKGETPLRLSDGREFTLVLDHEALIQAGTAYGQGIKRLFRDLQPLRNEDGSPALDEDGSPLPGPHSEAALRALLFGALTAKHPRATLRDASEIMFADMDAVGEAIQVAGKASGLMGDDGKEGGRETPDPQTTGLGINSGASGAKPDSNPKPSGGKRRARSS